MKRALMLAGLMCLPFSASARHKGDVDPRVQQVRTVFIKGNNEATVKARDNLAKWTCFRLAKNAAEADATLEFSQQQSVNGSVLASNRERSIVSAELTSKDGDVLWSSSATWDAGLINTGAGSGAHVILNHLQADAFPQVKLGFRGVSKEACPQGGASDSTEPPASEDWKPFQDVKPTTKEDPAKPASAAAARPRKSSSG